MRVETTRSAGVVRLRHGAGFTTSPHDVVAQARPLAAAARQRGEPVALAVRPATAEALAAALREPPSRAGASAFPLVAPDAAAHPPVLLSRPDGPDRSGQTLAARWARELRALTQARSGAGAGAPDGVRVGPVGPGSVTGSGDGAADPDGVRVGLLGPGSVTVIVEHDGDLDGIDGGFWTELDAALNIALTEVAATVVCLYPQFPLHLEVAEGARRNHPLLLIDGALRHNPAYREPRDVLTGRGAPAPAVLGPPDRQVAFDTWQLVAVRESVAQAARAAGCDADRVADLVLAVNEVATNAVEHGSGDAHLALWTGPGIRELLCEVHDDGPLADPLPGLRSPHPADPRGRGLWIARQLCDLLHIWSDTAGTHVRIRAMP